VKTDSAATEEGYQDLLRGMERKPIPTVESLIHVQRLMKLQNPKIGDVKLDDLNDGPNHSQDRRKRVYRPGVRGSGRKSKVVAGCGR
jgi:hypothetical protein